MANRPAFRSQLCHQLLVQGKWLAYSEVLALGRLLARLCTWSSFL